MELQQLRYFITAAEHQNISRAAKELMISQPALSRSIRALEADLGAVLFERKNSHVVLTEAGRRMLQHAREMLTMEERIRKEMLECCSPEKAPVRLVCRCIRQLLYSSISKFNEKYPEARFVILQNDDLAICSQEYDLMISSTLECTSDRSHHKLLQERFLCAVASDSSFAAKHSISLKEFASTPQILFGGHRQVRNTVQTRLQSLGIHPVISMTCDDSSTACHFVAAGYGVFLVPEFTISPDLAKIVRLLPVNGLDLTRDVYLSWDANKYQPLYAQRFRTFLIHDLSSPQQSSFFGPSSTD